MKCPMCKSRAQVEIDLHAEGFSQDARECGSCGAVWTFSGEKLKIITITHFLDVLAMLR